MDTILLVDDEPGVVAGQRKLLTLNGFPDIREALDGTSMRAVLSSEPIALVLLDLRLPGESGCDLLTEVRERYPDTVVVIVTGRADVNTAVKCIRAGAYDYVVKGGDSNRLPSVVRNALTHRRTQRENILLRAAVRRSRPQQPEAFCDFLTADERVRRVLVYLEALASLPDPLLITGETGVGKELLARGVHRAGGKSGEFVAVNVGGLDDHVFSDTLFGHVKGAFTGADTSRDGLVRRAAGGTLFLDEIADTSPESQTRLLRLLDRGEYFPLGSDRVEQARTRIICATNRSLPEDVRIGRFRRDLYYRVSTHAVEVPPLRERPADVPLLLLHSMDLEARRLNRPPLTIDDSVLGSVSRRELSGNVRELQQIVVRALIDGSWEHLITAASTVDADPMERGNGTASSSFPEPEDGSVELPGCDEGVGEGRNLHGRIPRSNATVVFGDQLPTPDALVAELLREADRRHPGSRSQAAAAVGLSLQAYSNRWRRMERRAVAAR